MRYYAAVLEQWRAGQKVAEETADRTDGRLFIPAATAVLSYYRLIVFQIFRSKSLFSRGAPALFVSCVRQDGMKCTGKIQNFLLQCHLVVDKTSWG